MYTNSEMDRTDTGMNRKRDPGDIAGVFFLLQNEDERGNDMYPFNPYQFQPQSTQVVKVNGLNGANAFAIGPNSSALLLDESGTLVWLVTTDGAGYKTVSPYDITPHKEPAAPDYGSLEQRLTKLEGIINEYAAHFAATGTEPHAAD